MAYEIFTELDLNQNSLINAALDNLATTPATPVAGQIYFDTTLGVARVWNGAAWAAAGGSTPKFATNVGDGLALSYVVTHNLNTRDFVASVFDNITFNEILTVVTHSTVNTATITFSAVPGVNAYRVTIIA